MHIESLSLRNFRCFGDTAIKIEFQPGITAFVGDNGSGKSAALVALMRLFSRVPSERYLRKSDVHFGIGEDSESVVDREIVIDVVFGGFDKEKRDVPHVFNDFLFNAIDESLKARLVLEGRYLKSESDEDDIEVKLYTVYTLGDIPFGPESEQKTPLSGRPTRLVELAYIPAHRDSSGIMRHALKNLLKRIERSTDWDDNTRRLTQDLAKGLEENLNLVTSISSVTNDLKSIWEDLHDGHYDAEPHISVVATEFEKLIRDLTLRFEKSPGGGQRQLEELSEGQVSLLYFALSATLHKLLWKMGEKPTENLEGFKALDYVPAPLAIFALEEPENHLAPFYLPRLIGLLKELIDTTGSVQSFVTSHSASVLSRIDPRNVRYFRNCRRSLISDVKAIPLPPEGSKLAGFLHQVILANPEIYFARLVIVGEGDSERIVIPRIAEALGISLDPSFVAFVPIGGRHAQHLWKLVTELKIPCITLLDFDLGRYNGGMGRITNAVTWLSDAGCFPDPPKVISNEELGPDNVKSWVQWLRSQWVFYSTYLDLDMMMVEAFPKAYSPSRNFDEARDDPEKIAKAVFGANGPGDADLSRVGASFPNQMLFTYMDLFKSRSKPASHYKALAVLDDEEISVNCPEPLRALICAAKTILRSPLPTATVEEE